MLKVVLFDFDDTLCAEIEPERQALLAACGVAARDRGIDTRELAGSLRGHASRL